METNAGIKNIVLCSDGTGNRDVKARGTNVFKIYEAVDIQGYKTDPSIPRQVAFYDDGLGTSKLLPLKIIGGAFGYGFSQNIRDLYTELVEVYQPGDNIYLFGFSRGAYTIRALSAMIYYCGILDPAKFKPAGEIYKQIEKCFAEFRDSAFRHLPKEAERRSAIPDRLTNEMEKSRREKYGAIMDDVHARNGEVPIRFIGVWDTVGAVGIPFGKLLDWFSQLFPVRFSDLTMAANVIRGCHAISIDDERRTFYPELWNEKGGKEDRTQQVWFSGVHSNVGGGYPKQGMSLVTLDWMMQEAEAAGLHFIPSEREYVRSHQDVHGHLYDSRAGIYAYYRWAPRNIERICKAHNILNPKIHVSVFERIANGTDAYAPGNIPFQSEIVKTGNEKGWPSDDAIMQIREIFLKQPRENANCLLSTMDRTVWSGKRSYTTFILLILVALAFIIWSLYNGRPILIIPSVFAFAVLAAAIWNWAVRVGKNLDDKYSAFWQDRRRALGSLLDQRGGK